MDGCNPFLASLVQSCYEGVRVLNANGGILTHSQIKHAFSGEIGQPDGQAHFPFFYFTRGS